MVAATHTFAVSDRGVELGGPPAAPMGPPRDTSDPWQFDDALSRIKRSYPLRMPQPAHGGPHRKMSGRVHAGFATSVAPTPTKQPTAGRIDPAHAARNPSHLPVSGPQVVSATAAAPAAVPIRSIVAWTLLALGLAAAVCGALLMVRSWITGRSDLWSVGVPITLAGECSLVAGLIVQLSRSKHSRGTTPLDRPIDRHTPENTPHTAPAPHATL